MKYKVGQKLTVKKGHEQVCGSYKGEKDPSYIVITETYGSSFDYNYDIFDSNGKRVDDCSCFTDEDLIPFKKTLENLEVGDMVKDEDGTYLVLAVCGNVVCLSTKSNHVVADTWYTAKELKDDGFTVSGQKDEEVETIEIGGIKYSKEEVEDKLKDLEAVE